MFNIIPSIWRFERAILQKREASCWRLGLLLQRKKIQVSPRVYFFWITLLNWFGGLWNGYRLALPGHYISTQKTLYWIHFLVTCPLFAGCLYNRLHVNIICKTNSGFVVSGLMKNRNSRRLIRGQKLVNHYLNVC